MIKINLNLNGIESGSANSLLKCKRTLKKCMVAANEAFIFHSNPALSNLLHSFDIVFFQAKQCYKNQHFNINMLTH